MRRVILPLIVTALLGPAIAGSSAGRSEDEPVLNLYLARVKTAKVAQLTVNRRDEAGPQSPSWAPDGHRLVFSATACESCRQELRLLDLSAGPRSSSRHIGFGSRPRWSPDGKKIAYLSATGDLFVRAFGAGSTPRLLRKNVPPDGASWAPDSRKLVIVLRTHAGTYAIEILSLRGRTMRRLVKSRAPLADPAWSPNGREIAYAGQGRSGLFQLYTVGLARGTVRRLGSASFSQTSPSWSPDSSKLVFVGSEAGRAAIYVMARRGGRARRLTPTSLLAMQPDWSPRGPLIVFAAKR